MKNEIIPPKNGWEENTWYRGVCSMRPGNPKFKVLIFSGFLNGGKKDEKIPGGYSGVFSENYVPSESDNVWKIHTPMYLKVTERLFKVKS